MMRQAILIRINQNDDNLISFFAFLQYFLGIDGRIRFFQKWNHRIKILLENCHFSDYSGFSLAIIWRLDKISRDCLISVSITDLSVTKFCAPLNDLNCPDIFCFTLTFRMALSEPLLSGGTSYWYKNTNRWSRYLLILLRKVPTSLYCFSIDSLRSLSSLFSNSDRSAFSSWYCWASSFLFSLRLSRNNFLHFEAQRCSGYLSSR